MPLNIIVVLFYKVNCGMIIIHNFRNFLSKFKFVLCLAVQACFFSSVKFSLRGKYRILISFTYRSPYCYI